MGKRFTITLVALVLGFMLAVQFRTTNRVEPVVPFDRAMELTAELKALDREKRGLEADARDLDRKLSRARMGYSQAEDILKAEVSDSAEPAGMTTVRGPGVRVRITNPGGGTDRGAIFAVRDEDLLKLVNELRAAGAEAISINGQRIVSTSEIRLAGSFINVNTQKIAPPYEILAIGGPAALRSGLEIRGGLVETLREWGMEVTVEVKDNIVIPAYRGSLRFEYAHQLKEGV
ncbi:MAG: DUF881 domain-containing protein [Firmicutes bacterium]|nr:DUF881 domain-containing protein [Bacillota bacterium]